MYSRCARQPRVVKPPDPAFVKEPQHRTNSRRPRHRFPPPHSDDDVQSQQQQLHRRQQQCRQHALGSDAACPAPSALHPPRHPQAAERQQQGPARISGRHATRSVVYARGTGVWRWWDDEEEDKDAFNAIIQKAIQKAILKPSRSHPEAILEDMLAQSSVREGPRSLGEGCHLLSNN